MPAFGRVVEHDPRSKLFPVSLALAAPGVKTVLHKRHVPIFDQGQLGSCTGNAAAGCMATGPWRHRTTETTAVRLYKRATVLDGFDGTYPPDDTGSSGLAVMKAVLERKWIGSYQHAFALRDVLIALQTTPLITGVNWYGGMMRTDSSGKVYPTGQVEGGHEVCLVGADLEQSLLRIANSWSPEWGDKGFCSISFDDFSLLMSQQGDVTVPVPK